MDYTDILENGNESRSNCVKKTKGSIDLMMGCMWSGKTSELLRIEELLLVAYAPGLILKLKPCMDDERKGVMESRKYANDSLGNEANGKEEEAHDQEVPVGLPSSIRSHSGQKSFAWAVTNLMSVCSTPGFKRARYIFIDEGQFFPTLRKFSVYSASMGKNVYIAALNGDYKQEMFESVIEVMPVCSNVRMSHGICMQCRRTTSAFTILNAYTEKPDTQILVGGADKYIPVCGSCLYIIEKGPPSPIIQVDDIVVDDDDIVAGCIGTPPSSLRDYTEAVSEHGILAKRNRPKKRPRRIVIPKEEGRPGAAIRLTYSQVVYKPAQR
jgi:thymidine kinase